MNYNELQEIIRNEMRSKKITYLQMAVLVRQKDDRYNNMNPGTIHACLNNNKRMTPKNPE